MKTTTCYLYLESFVFLFVKKEKGLLYDSFAKKSYPFVVGGELEGITAGLADVSNMYVLEVTHELLADTFVKQFVDLIRQHYLGDVIPTAVSPIKPVLFPPILDFQRSKAESEKNKGDDVLKNLNELTIYLTEKCDNTCCSQKCSLFSKQCLFCRKKEDGEFLNFGALKNYLKYLPVSHFPIHIVGGDLKQYPDWEELVLFFSDYEQVDYWIHYSFFARQSDIWKGLSCKILVDYPIDTDMLNEVFSGAKQQIDEVSFRFLVKDLESFQQALSYQQKYPLFSIDILPVYDENEEFFYENIYSTMSDLEEISLSKKEIFANQVMNTNHFGKLTIDSAGMIYTNLNELPIGHISSEEMKASVSKALIGKDQAWLRTRSMEPCSDCIYQWLCPPLSDYDYVIGKSNLCQIKLECHV